MSFDFVVLLFLFVPSSHREKMVDHNSARYCKVATYFMASPGTVEDPNGHLHLVLFLVLTLMMPSKPLVWYCNRSAHAYRPLIIKFMADSVKLICVFTPRNENTWFATFLPAKHERPSRWNFTVGIAIRVEIQEKYNPQNMAWWVFLRVIYKIH